MGSHTLGQARRIYTVIHTVSHTATYTVIHTVIVLYAPAHSVGPILFSQLQGSSLGFFFSLSFRDSGPGSRGSCCDSGFRVKVSALKFLSFGFLYWSRSGAKSDQTCPRNIQNGALAGPHRSPGGSKMESRRVQNGARRVQNGGQWPKMGASQGPNATPRA